MINDLLSARWLPVYESQHNNKRPIVVVGTVTNKSHEHINAETFIKDIEKAILMSDIGINPTNDGTVIRLVFPELTEDRRKELAKDVKKKGEASKVAVRNIRRDGNDAFKKLKGTDVSEDEIQDLEDQIQKLTDKMIAKVDKAVEEKTAEIMTV